MSKNEERRLHDRLQAIIQKLEKYDVTERANKVKDWNEIIHDFDKLLKDYSKHLPQPVRDNINILLTYTQPPDFELPQPFNSVKDGLKQVATSKLASTGGLSTTAIIGIVVAGVVVAVGLGGYFYAKSTTSYLVVENVSCEPINLQAPGSFLGSLDLVRFPSQPVTSGSTGTIEMPAGSILLDFRDRSKMIISGYGQTFPVLFPSNVQDVEFNRSSVSGTSITASFDQGATNTVTVRCA
jgi:hypothetical protein